MCKCLLYYKKNTGGQKNGEICIYQSIYQGTKYRQAAASKAANVKIQSVERNRLKSGACVKMRGSVSDVNAAMEVALEAARPLGKVVSHTVIASPSEDTEIALKMTINK